jgi:enoyl-[acyl-carrier protein] reductase I
MGFLSGKRVLILGLLSTRSIAHGIAKACREQGAELAFTYQNERFEQRVKDMAAEFGSSLVFPCDVAEDSQISALFEALKPHWDSFDGLVRSRTGLCPKRSHCWRFFGRCQPRGVPYRP